jgi:hypothetical protein
VTITGSYHAGKFLRPHGKNGKVYFPQDGTIYFKPDLSRYGAIQPLKTRCFRPAGHRARACQAESRMATNVWLVLLHHAARLAASQFVVANAFGDRYVYNLPLGARGYLCGRPRPRRHRGLIPSAACHWDRIATTRMATIMSSLNRPNRWLDSQLGLCSAPIAWRARRAPGFKWRR